MLVRGSRGRVLGVRRPDGFGLPAGSREPCDADLAATAAREALEETGLALDPARLEPAYAERRAGGTWVVTFRWPEVVDEREVRADAPGDGLGCAWVEPLLLTHGSQGPYNRRLLEVDDALPPVARAHDGPPSMRVRVRPARDDDGEALIAILGSVFAEYEGCLLERSELPELVRPATSFASMGGSIWVAERGGRQVGLVAVTPSTAPGSFELKKLYTLAEARGLGLGRRLVELVEHEVARRGGAHVHLWSDTRFVTAHGVYEHLGYTRLPGTRPLHDVSNTIEFHYERHLPRPRREPSATDGGAP